MNFRVSNKNMPQGEREREKEKERKKEELGRQHQGSGLAVLDEQESMR